MAAIPNEETLKQDVQNNLHNKDPQFVGDALSTVVTVIQSYGWFVIGAVVFAFYVISKIKPKLKQLQESAADGVFKKTDVNAASQRAEAMARSRQKMQEKLDEQAVVAKQKQAEKDEQKRLEKIENHELALQGKSKLKPKDAAADSSTPGKGPKPKKTLRGDYNPLMGDSCSYRPARKGPSAGG